MRIIAITDKQLRLMKEKIKILNKKNCYTRFFLRKIDEKSYIYVKWRKSGNMYNIGTYYDIDTSIMFAIKNKL